MEKYGFVYIWQDLHRKLYYIGCHWGTIEDGYICSSNRMRKAYRRRPKDFKRRIIKTNIPNKYEMFITEEKWLKLAEKKKYKYYNLKFALNHSPRATGYKHSEETKEKIRSKHIGKKMSVEARTKMSESFTGRKWTPEQREKMKFRKTLKGRKLSEEHKLKIKNKLSGVKHSEERKTKTALARVGLKYNKEKNAIRN